MKDIERIIREPSKDVRDYISFLSNQSRIKEEIRVKFNTAVLAREKGFDIPCRYSYGMNPKSSNYGSSDIFNGGMKLSPTGMVTASPTLSALQRWLREEYGIVVLIHIDRLNTSKYGVFYWWEILEGTNNYKTYVYKAKSNSTFDVDEYKTYEKALEAGLFKALKLVK